MKVRSTNPGLPRGISPHGTGYRCRYKPDPYSAKAKWSPVFPTAEACLAYLQVAQQAWRDSRPAPTPVVRPVRQHWTFSEYARGPWWLEYLRGNPAESTQKDTLRLLALHVEPCAWAHRDLCDIPRRLLRDWFDMRMENPTYTARFGHRRAGAGCCAHPSVGPWSVSKSGRSSRGHRPAEGRRGQAWVPRPRSAPVRCAMSDRCQRQQLVCQGSGDFVPGGDCAPAEPAHRPDRER